MKKHLFRTIRPGLFSLITAVLIMMTSAGFTVFGQTVVTNPTSPWTVPAGVSSVKVEVWGAGGGGGGSKGVGGNGAVGGGGGGGAYAIQNLTVSAGQTYTITYGPGGTAGTSGGGNGGLGGTTTFTGTGGTCSAAGGTGGVGKTTTGAGANGTGGNSGTGYLYAGGNGGVGAANASYNYSGGGGGGAGNAAAGSAGTSNSTNGGVGGAGGIGSPNSAPYKGGVGGSNNNLLASQAGGAGTAPGGGGAGGSSYTTNVAGGAGAAGQVVLTYTVVACTTPTTTYTVTGGGAYCSGGSGVAVGLSGSQSGVTYQLYNGASPVGGTTSGTGSALAFGNQTAAGTYTVKTTTAGGYCAATMTGSQTVSITANPFTPTPITGTTNVCIGGTTTLTSALPSGGTVTSYGTYPNSYTVETFNSSGTLAVPATMTNLTGDVLVVAGGGGGGSNGGGGGGAGGMNYTANVSIPTGNTAVTVGSGGAAAASSSVPGSNGGSSSLGALVTAVGGGGGGSRDAGAGGQVGGSGGGGGGSSLSYGTCNPSTVSGYDDDFYGSGISATISCLPAGGVITGVVLNVSIDNNCPSWYMLGYSRDNSNFYYQGSGCGGTYPNETLWNGLTNGSKIYLTAIDNDGWEDDPFISINSATVISYSYPGTRYLGGAGTAGQGNAGGNGTTPDAGCNSAGGGGGGAGGLGTAGTGSGITSTGGGGGAGLANSITGTSVTYAGGGGGGTTGYIGCGTVTSITNGAGGSGVGSNGESGTSGAANKGGGGGAETSGGSGVVILRFPGGKWTSSNTSVATIDQAGVVTGVAGGTTTITYTVATGTCTTSTSTTVTVNAAATSVQLAPSTTTAAEQCTESGWTYYANAATPTNWIFAIFKNGNAFSGTASINVKSATPTAFDSVASIALHKATFTMGRYWNYTLNSGSISSPVKVRFFYTAADSAAMQTAAANWATAHGGTVHSLEWFKTSGTAYNPANNTYSSVPTASAYATAYGQSNGIHYAELSGITSFSGGTMGLRVSPGGLALPVTFITFTATPLRDQHCIRLDWATASEINNEGFSIERSTDGKNFAQIAWQTGAGNSNSTLKYSYDDRKVSDNVTYYYHLIQKDFDGAQNESDLVSAILTDDNNTAYSLKPNPVPSGADHATLTIVSTTEKNVTIDVYDILGKHVSSFTQKLEQNSNDIPVTTSGLIPGLYLIVITDPTAEDRITKRFVKD